MNALEMIESLEHLILDVPLDEQNIIELRAKARGYIPLLKQSLTPTVEQEEILEIVDWLTTGHPTKQSFIDGLRKDGYVDLANDYIEDDIKCDKLCQYIMQPNKAVNVIKNKIIEIKNYSNSICFPTKLKLLEELLNEIGG